jgi:hypothetical protein
VRKLIFKLAVEIEQAIEEKRKMLHQERKKEKELEKRVGFYFIDSPYFLNHFLVCLLNYFKERLYSNNSPSRPKRTISKTNSER